jgi:hypothetical protein
MKTIVTCLFLSLSLASSAFAGGGTVGSDTFSRKVCASKVAMLEEKVELTKFQVDAGAAGFDEVRSAELELILMQFNCHTITIDQFCTKAPAIVNDLVSLVEAGYRDGSSNKIDLLDMKMKALDITEVCQ